MPPTRLQPAPGEDPLASFSPVDEVELCRLDRSAVQDWEECPRRAALIETGNILTTSDAAVTGNEAHQCFGDTITEYIDRSSMMPKSEIKEWLEGAARHSRPDVQPGVIQAVKYSAWAFAEFLHGTHHENILHYDGGEGERSGQLAVEWPDLSALITSEIDLLCAGDTKEILEETDYKCGDKIHLESTVKNGFQFQFHAVLIFEKYDQAQELRVRIWNTKRNRPTYFVPFYRKDLSDYRCRVRSAVSQWHRYRGVAPGRCPTWATKEKCRICDAATMCDASGLYGTPEQTLMALVATRAKAKRFEDDLTAIVDKAGRDVTAGGYAFGRCKPKRETRAASGLYEVTNG